MPKRVKILTKLWLIYFVSSIALIGVFFSGMFYFPLYAASRIFPSLKPSRERAMSRAVRVLMGAQPWYRAEVDIQMPATEGGVLIVSNHRSHLDVFILLSRVIGIRVLAKASLFKIPGLSIYMRATEQIRVERGALDAWVRAMTEVGKRLGRGERVHVFPELTRCEPGFKGMRPFAAGPFQAAMQQDALVLPIVIENTDGVWPKGRPGIHYGQKVRAHSLPPLRARDFTSAFQLRDEVQKRMEQVLL